MKFLLLIMLFQPDAQGDPGVVTVAQQVFEDEASCQAQGAKAKEAIPAPVRAIAICVPEIAFQGKPKAATPGTPPAAAPGGRPAAPGRRP